MSRPSSRPIKLFRYKNFLSRTRPVGAATRAANLTDSIVVRKTVFNEIGGMRQSSPETFHNEDSHLLLKLGSLQPCIVIDQPAITAYRKHATNSSGNVSAVAEGSMRIARAERRGEYVGKNRVGPLRTHWRTHLALGGEILLARGPAQTGSASAGRDFSNDCGGAYQQSNARPAWPRTAYCPRLEEWASVADRNLVVIYPAALLARSGCVSSCLLMAYKSSCSRLDIPSLSNIRYI